MRHEPAGRHVVFFGTYDDRLHPRVRSLIDGAGELGYRVTEVTAPSGLSTSDRVRLARRPWEIVGVLGALAGQRRELRRQARRIDDADVVIVGYLGVIDAPRASAWFDAPVVLDHLAPVAETLEDRGMSAPVVLAGRWLDRRAERAVDLVVVDTDEARALVGEGAVATVPVGCGRNWFDAGERRVEADPDGPLRVIFYGLFTPLQGIPTIVEAAHRTASTSIEWTIVGSGQERDIADRLEGHPHIRLLDWCDPADLPALLASHDVCLGVFGGGPKAIRVVPNKVVQGLATGCAVVTSASPPQRRLLEGNALLVPVDDAEALTAAIERLAADRELAAELGRRGRAVADAELSPAAVAGRLLSAAFSLGTARTDSDVE